MAISDKLQELLDIKQDIKVAIENKGADLTGVDFGGYAEKIDEIETDGGDILYHGSGLGSGYAQVKYGGVMLMLNIAQIKQDFPSISEARGLFIINDGTNTTIGQGLYYTQDDNSSFSVSNAYMIIFSNGLIILKFDTSVAPPGVELTQAMYDGLSVYDNNTYYLIVEE